MLLKRLTPTGVSHELLKTSNSYGNETPLVQAVRNCDTGLLDCLFRAGADLDLEGGPDGTALSTACKLGFLPAVQFLVRNGANMSIEKDGLFYNAIETAAEFPDIVWWLLVANTPINSNSAGIPKPKFQRILWGCLDRFW